MSNVTNSFLPCYCALPFISPLYAGGPATSAALLPPLCLLGSRLYRTLGALTATWLSRLMLAQMPGLSGRSSGTSSSGGGGGGGGHSAATAAAVAAGDREVLALAGRLVQGALAAPAQLLLALGDGGAQLEAAAGVLQGPAVAGEVPDGRVRLID